MGSTYREDDKVKMTPVTGHDVNDRLAPKITAVLAAVKASQDAWQTNTKAERDAWSEAKLKVYRDSKERADREREEKIEKYRYVFFGLIKWYSRGEALERMAYRSFDMGGLYWPPRLGMDDCPTVPLFPETPKWAKEAVQLSSASAMFPEAEYEVPTWLIDAVVAAYDGLKT